MADFHFAPLGYKFTRNVGPDNSPVEYEVVGSCGENSGQWFCITCTVGFRNNFERDLHNHTHTFTWVCFEHGPEVP